ncbi:MAG: TetR/AcrR family transcriptional regulator [Rhodobacteraceae bacterium]|jgi:AcrR family transcriptional regulator|nr:TetR/AcrR family transcriptional regulator [Paracoccaceae bacterium]
MGLRAKHKADRTERIIHAAAQMFRTLGFDAVRMEAIAALAGVSAGTVYNYFPTKGDLLVAIVSREVEEVLAAGEATVTDPPPDVVGALSQLVHGYYDHSLHYLSKDMWRTAMAMTIQSPEKPSSRNYVALDGRLQGQVVALIAALQARGHIRAALDPIAVGAMLFHNLDALFRMFVTTDQTLEALRAEVDRHHRAMAALMAV